MQDTERAFDLNVGTVLEHWTPEFALREIIANALDESILTDTQTPTISQDADAWWHIRDFGRGLRHVHLTQDESPEKRHDKRMIGQFGMGLKDALALFDRIDAEVIIYSRHGDIRLGRHRKSDFDDVVTLHALIADPTYPTMVGTDFAVHGVSEERVDLAKDMFLAFREDAILESTTVGQVLAKEQQEPGRIYVRGLLVAVEENFLFSYNIASLNGTLRRALNRERSNVGRTAYTERVKRILLDCTQSAVAGPLANDLGGYATGAIHDEVAWTDVALHATRIMQTTNKVIFVTATDFQERALQIDHARADGYTPIHVPDKIADKLTGMTDLGGRPIFDVRQYATEWNDSVQYTFIEPEDLTEQEQGVLATASAIFDLLGVPHPGRGVVRELRISETMRMGRVGVDASGVWEPIEGRVIIARHALSTHTTFAGTLLHEICHARSGLNDLSIAFEDNLTTALGTVACSALALISAPST